MADSNNVLSRIVDRNAALKTYLKDVTNSVYTEDTLENFKKAFSVTTDDIQDLLAMLTASDATSNSMCVARSAAITELLMETLKDYRDITTINMSRRDILSRGFDDDLNNADYVIVT